MQVRSEPPKANLRRFHTDSAAGDEAQLSSELKEASPFSPLASSPGSEAVRTPSHDGERHCTSTPLPGPAVRQTAPGSLRTPDSTDGELPLGRTSPNGSPRQGVLRSGLPSSQNDRGLKWSESEGEMGGGRGGRVLFLSGAGAVEAAAAVEESARLRSENMEVRCRDQYSQSPVSCAIEDACCWAAGGVRGRGPRAGTSAGCAVVLHPPFAAPLLAFSLQLRRALDRMVRENEELVDRILEVAFMSDSEALGGGGREQSGGKDLWNSPIGALCTTFHLSRVNNTTFRGGDCDHS